MDDVIVYLREIDRGTDNACWVVCAKGDPGAVPFTPVDYEPDGDDYSDRAEWKARL